MKLVQFSGGINIKDAPHLVAINEALVYKNIDSQPGSLKPVAGLSVEGTTRKKYSYFFEPEGIWFESDTRRDYVEYESGLYWTEDAGSYKYKNGLTQNLGIQKPLYKPSASKLDAPAQLTQVTINNKTISGDLSNNNLDYLLVNVDVNGNYSKGLVIRVSASTTIITAANSYDYVEANWENITKLDTSSGTSPRSVEFKEFLGVIADKALLFRFYDDAFYLVGTIVDKNTVIVDSVADITGNLKLDTAKFGPLSGVYTYVYTFYNSYDGTESAPSAVSNEIDVKSGKVELSNMSISSDPQVDLKRIYRVGGSLAKFTLVAEVANATTTYLDELKDIDLSGELLEAVNYFAPPVGLKYLTEAYAMLFGAVGSKLYFTPIGLPNAWPGDYFIECVKLITGIGVTANGLLVFTDNSTIIVSGTGPTSLAKSTLSKTQGCISHYSIANLDGVVYWASNDGICVSSGNKPTVVTKPKLGKIKFDTVQAILHDEVYYLLEKSGRITALDFRYTPLVKQLDFNLANLVLAKDILYGWKDGKLFELFAGSAVEFEYLSPKLSDGRVTEKKTYKKVYIYSIGVIELNIFVEDKLVQTVTLTGQDAHSIQIPQQYQRGCYIQFGIKGTGELLELEYSAEGRKDE